MLNRTLGAAIMAVALGGGLAGPAYQPPRITINQSKYKKRTLFSDMVYATQQIGTHKASGITTARQQRAAKKVRNRARNKLAIKRAR